MSNLQLIEALCKLVEDQAAIILKLFLRLAEADAVAVAEEVQEVRKRYSDILGSDETPDELYEEFNEREKSDDR